MIENPIQILSFLYTDKAFLVLKLLASTDAQTDKQLAGLNTLSAGVITKAWEHIIKEVSY